MNQELDGQLQLFYTEEELQTKINNAVTNLNEAHAREIQYVSSKARRTAQDNAIEACRGMLGEVDEESMLSIYNTIAEAVGWDTIEAFTKLYAVTVMYQGHEVALFNDVEANDDDEACTTVLENMNIQASITVTVEYGNNSDSAEVDIDSWDLDTDEFTAEATEQ